MELCHGTEPDQEIEDTMSALFNDADADVVFRSRDKIRFRIYSTYLKNTTGGFPPVGFTPHEDEIVDLDENASTLNLMFQFVYPQPQPPLRTLDFPTLSSLAEAVEKYQIYPAMQICYVFMTKALPSHALDILDYAIKHDYYPLMDKAAPHISLEDVSSAATRVSPRLLQIWIPYHNACNQALRDAFKINEPHKRPRSSFESCTEWETRRASILITLGGCIGVKNVESALASIACTSPDCCREAAVAWQAKARQGIAKPPKFSTFSRKSFQDD
ncbi:hypothetical protein Hypma_006160 [Hypsizygus marmoreus]|uniref:BTB domain-containing protein n=1 Tax=Hypsizygus marmoreus TaxID=39966 RepID=A0A369JWT2_HYPMA|nr:hypothetical protein Hypma_006160 [Hypsizygus marmoreus]